MTRWLVTGAGGMLGRDLVAALRRSGAEVTAATRRDVDVTDPLAVAAAVAGHNVVVNAAAWTDVDAAETHVTDAMRVNALAPELLAAACAAEGAFLVQISTDYVFDGMADAPYSEDVRTAPRSMYGRSKLAGENAVRALLPDDSYIVRTAWLYGQHGRNFVRTMVNLEATSDVLDVVDDQFGQPTWSCDVAMSVLALVGSQAAPGVFHVTASGRTTWFGLARAVFEELGADPQRVRPVSTSRFPRPAPRPAYSVLGHTALTRAGVPRIDDWRARLTTAFSTVAAIGGV